MLTQFTLVRHGEPEGAHRLLGRTNPPLTEKGYQQLVDSCGQCRVDRVLSSPLSRCVDFSRRFSEQHQLPLTIDERLQELDFGDWDGRALEELWQLPSQAFESYWQQPWQRQPPRGESTQALLKRVRQCLEDLACEYPQQHLLLLTHSGVMRVVLSWLLAGTPSGNAHLSRVEIKHGARLTVSIYRDNDAVLWPQLIELIN